jgi:hypothetical protein
MKKYCLLEIWKRKVMERRRVRIRMRHNINPFMFFNNF